MYRYITVIPVEGRTETDMVCPSTESRDENPEEEKEVKKGEDPWIVVTGKRKGRFQCASDDNQELEIAH